MNRKRQIPVFFDGVIGVVGLHYRPEWRVARWLVHDGAQISGETIIVEHECREATMEHVVVCSGTLRHLVGEGEEFRTTDPIAQIECDVDQRNRHLADERARLILIHLTKGELEEVERLKAEEPNDQFVYRLVKDGLERLKQNPR